MNGLKGKRTTKIFQKENALTLLFIVLQNNYNISIYFLIIF